MSIDTGRSLNVWKQLLLATAAAGALVGPIAAGAMDSQAPPNGTPVVVERVPGVSHEPLVDVDHQFTEAAQEPLGVVDGHRYRHLWTGITFEVPEGWMVGSTYPSSDNGEQVVLGPTTNPHAEFHVWMVKEPVHPSDISPWLDGAPQQKLEQRHGNYRIHGAEDYRLREGSIYRIAVGGHQGIVAIADYTEARTRRAMAEYMTWIYTERGRTFFFARVAADELVLLQPQFDSIVNSAVIP